MNSVMFYIYVKYISSIKKINIPCIIIEIILFLRFVSQSVHGVIENYFIVIQTHKNNLYLIYKAIKVK